MGHRLPCVRAFSRTVPLWKPGCGRQAWCVGHERRYVAGPRGLVWQWGSPHSRAALVAQEWDGQGRRPSWPQGHQQSPRPTSEVRASHTLLEGRPAWKQFPYGSTAHGAFMGGSGTLREWGT